MSERRQWIGVASEWLGYQDDVAIVMASDEDEAAREVLAIFLSEDAKIESVDLLHVFVAPFDGRVAYQRTDDVERAELQCCGGPAPDYVGCGGHYATCPERPAGTGQPRDEDEAA